MFTLMVSRTKHEVPRPRYEIGRSSFKHRAALAWNILPHHIKECAKLRSFKIGLNVNKYLLNSIILSEVPAVFR